MKTERGTSREHTFQHTSTHSSTSTCLSPCAPQRRVLHMQRKMPVISDLAGGQNGRENEEEAKGGNKPIVPSS